MSKNTMPEAYDDAPAGVETQSQEETPCMTLRACCAFLLSQVLALSASTVAV